MKTRPTILLLAIAAAAAAFALTATRAAVEPAAPALEYSTICWGGDRDSLRVIQPDGKLDIIGPRLARTPLPDRTDPRAYFLNVVMNTLGKEGWQFAAANENQIIMQKRR